MNHIEIYMEKSQPKIRIHPAQKIVAGFLVLKNKTIGEEENFEDSERLDFDSKFEGKLEDIPF